jgi:hypothetical protein
MKIRLHDKFFTVKLSSSSSGEVKSASAAFAPKRDSVMCVHFYSQMIKLIDYKRFFRSFTRMLGRNAESYADVVLPKLRRHARSLEIHE